MTEKATFTNVDVPPAYAHGKEETHHDEAPHRQSSVAVNNLLVDNPLQVNRLQTPFCHLENPY
jgi:hypothetical protein